MPISIAPSRATCHPALFAVRQAPSEHDHIPGYAVRHPVSGAIVSNRSFENGYCEELLSLCEVDAVALAQELALKTGMLWSAERAPNPCPNCGRAISADDGDFCYPNNRERTLWRAGCNEHDFGCGHEVQAPTYSQALALWNCASD